MKNIKDHRIKVIHKKNEGQHIARLRGLQKAKAPYAMFCDSDDYVHFQMVEIFLDLIKAYKTEYIMCNYVVLYKNTRKNQQNLIYNNVRYNIIDVDNIWINQQSRIWGALFLTQKLKDIFLKVPTLKTIGEDTIVIRSYLNRMCRAIMISENLYFYRNRKSSTIHTMRKKNPFLLCNDLLTLRTFCSDLNEQKWDSSIIGGLVFCSRKERKVLISDAKNIMGPISTKGFSKRSVQYWKLILFKYHFYGLLKILFYFKDFFIKKNKQLYE